MNIEPLSLPGLFLLKPRIFVDDRGYFLETYRQPLYVKAGIGVAFAQDNISFSRYGVLRGLHDQTTPGQAKLVSVIQGRIWDVAVDLRPTSPTFGKWEGVELDGENHFQFFIPVGFAHGFCILSKTALVSYKVSSPYDPPTERTIAWNDPDLSIAWPIKEPLVSERDQNGLSFQSLKIS
jgi:dTDP-4-dehydrorhamnose 3,5-epimerase